MRKLVLVLVAIATFSCSVDADRSGDSKEDCGIVTDKFIKSGAFVIELDGYKEIFLQEFKWNQINTDDKYCN